MDDKERIAALEAEKTALESKLASATGELVDDRKKRQAVEGERDALQVKIKELENKPTDPPAQPTDQEAVIRKVLAERDQADAALNLSNAERAFKERYKADFDESGDPGGLKFSAIKAKFDRFNTSGAKTITDFLEFYEEAYTLVNPQKPPAPTYTPYAATPPISGEGPREQDKNPLSATEKTIVERLGWTLEKYLEQKAKRPEYIASLLKQLN